MVVCQARNRPLGGFVRTGATRQIDAARGVPNGGRAVAWRIQHGLPSDFTRTHRTAKKKAHHLLQTGYKKIDVYKFES